MAELVQTEHVLEVVPGHATEGVLSDQTRDDDPKAQASPPNHFERFVSEPIGTRVTRYGVSVGTSNTPPL